MSRLFWQSQRPLSAHHYLEYWICCLLFVRVSEVLCHPLPQCLLLLQPVQRDTSFLSIFELRLIFNDASFFVRTLVVSIALQKLEGPTKDQHTLVSPAYNLDSVHWLIFPKLCTQSIDDTRRLWGSGLKKFRYKYDGTWRGKRAHRMQGNCLWAGYRTSDHHPFNDMLGSCAIWFTDEPE